MRSLVLVSALGAAAVLVACGLSVTGSAEPGGDGGTGTAGDETDGSGPGSIDGTSDASGTNQGEGGAADAASDTGPADVCISDACAAAAPPTGFTPVLLGGATDACPAGFTTTDMIESPTAAADACACGTCVMTGTTCSTGTLPTKYDNGSGTCGSTGGNLSASNGACNDGNGSFGENARIDPPAAVPGSCTAPSTGARAKVTSTARRVCALSPQTCSDRMCSPPSPLRACMMHDGDVACPADASDKHLVGPDFSITCGACSCTTVATCGGKAEFWSSNGCPGTPFATLNAGVCTDTNQASFSSYKWTGTVATQTCTNLTPPAAGVALTQTSTLCCPP